MYITCGAISFDLSPFLWFFWPLFPFHHPNSQPPVTWVVKIVCGEWWPVKKYFANFHWVKRLMLNFVACVIFWVHEIEKREARQFCLRNNSFSNCTRMQIISKVEYTVTCFEFTYIRRIALIISYSVLLACWTWTSQPISYQNATRRLFKTVVDVDVVIALYQLSPIPCWGEALELFYFVYIPFENTPCGREKKWWWIGFAFQQAFFRWRCYWKSIHHNQVLQLSISMDHVGKLRA